MHASWLLLGVIASAVAQEPVELSPMQVTAGREAEPAFQAPQPVTVLTREQIGARNPQVMTQALAYEPGAFFQQSGPGQGIVIVRGLKGSEVLHLVDGMRLNNAFFRNSPSQYIALLDPQNIARLELVRGPHATVYGSDAMGGVLQVLTPEYRFTSDDWQLQGLTRAHYGSADLARTGRVELAAGTRGLSLAGGLSVSEFGKRKLPGGGQSPDGTGGFTIEDRVNDTDYLSRGWDGKLLWTGGAHELMLATQSFGIPALQRYFQTVPGHSGGDPARRIAEFRNDRQFHHVRYRHLLPLGPLQDIEVHLARQDMTDDRLDRNFAGSRDEFTFNRSVLDGLTVQAETPFESHRLRYGFDAYADRVASSAYREQPPGSGTIVLPNGTSFFSPFPDGSRATELGVWLLDEWAVSDAATLEGSARYTRNETDVARGDRAFGAELSRDDVSGSLGSRMRLTDTVAWVANLGRGFRAPNLFDLALVGQRASNRVVIANLDLEPETVSTLDTGLKFAGSRWSGEAVVFYSEYRDRIVTVNPAFAEGEVPECPDDADAATTGCAQNQNIARSRYYGFEGGLRVAVNESMNARATLNYTWGDQEQAGTKTPANRVPPLNGQVGAEWRIAPGWSVEPWLFWADDQGRLDPNDLADSRIDPAGTPGYAVANLRTSWSGTEGLRLIGELRNLTDKAYREHGSGIDGPARGVALTAEYRLR